MADAVPSTVVVLTFWDPWEAPHGGTLRTRALCRAFAALGARVTCVFPASPTSVAGVVDGVERRPVTQQTVGHRSWPPVVQRAKRLVWPLPTSFGARSEQLRQALADQGAVDLLVVSHLSALQYHEVLPDAGLWLDQSDLWSAFAAREAAARRGPARITASVQARALARTEDRAAGTVDVLSAAGWADRQRLSDRSAATVWWLPTPVSAGAGSVPRPPTDRPVAGFIANFAYHPNRDALEVLTGRWLGPLQQAGWQVVVAGLGSDEGALPPEVRSLGPVDDVREFYAAVDVTLAPVRLGGGMKVKVIESLLHQRPVLATPFALDGFPADVRALAIEVPLDGTAVPSPAAALAAWRPVPDQVRRRFSDVGFTETVAEALRSRHGPHRRRG
jgi:polysaccharide biosynthesis protein PslH